MTVLLRAETPARGDQAWLAAVVGRSRRTLRTWVAQDASERGPGRPAHAGPARWHALRGVVRQWKVQGAGAGWRPLDAALPDVPTRLVQRVLPAVKARARRRQAAHVAAQRVHVEILGKDVLWSQDTTHVGTCAGRKVWSEVIEDVGTMMTRDAPVRARATRTEDVIAQLEALATKGALPLVWAVDWGSAYRSGDMTRWLDAHHVVLLPSLPHTPQHNPWVERKHRDLKAVSGLGRGVALESIAEAERRWAAAREVLDEHRLRSRLGCRTAGAVDRSLASWEGVIDRRSFHDAVRRAREQAALGTSSTRARQLAERQAVFTVLERYGLARRTRGGASLPSPEAEGIS